MAESAPYLIVIDEGTTSTRAILYAADGTPVASASHPITQIYPQPGWVEHDAAEIWRLTLAATRAMIERAGGARHVAAIGITNQRETVVAWDKRSGAPLCNAIVWQDRRTADFCAELKAAGHETEVQRRTGLLLDPYFSGSKMRWMADHVPAVRAAGAHLAFGTIESWLVWKLSGGAHVSDASNASRTMLLGLTGATWDAGLADLLGVPLSTLPAIVDCSGAIGETSPALFGAAIPICGMAGDQQAATIGQGCLAQGETKATFGTGAFILSATEATVPQSRNRLLATVLWQAGGVRHYALEGSVFVAGSLMQWLRDGVGLLSDVRESEQAARAVEDSGGVTLIPALAGLGAPHWRPDVTGRIIGLSLATRREHILRAALESMAHQCQDLATAFAADGAAWTHLRVDGGMSANNWMAQDLADILGVEVERPADVETTALGAAMLAAVGAGLYPSLEAAKVMRAPSTRFTPAMAADVRHARLAQWSTAMAALLAQP